LVKNIIFRRGNVTLKTKIYPMSARKTIALVAHDNQKDELLHWVKFNEKSLVEHSLYATGTTGWLLEKETGLPIHKLQSGPLGGDQQIGALISQSKIECLIFFWDPLEAQPHDPDIRALLRLAAVWNIPVATNRATADFLISSPLMVASYERIVPDYDAYRRRLEAQVKI
jgi:methylglyoxal synthase